MVMSQGFFSGLLDALADMLSPIFRPFLSKARLVVVEDGDAFAFYKVERGRAALIASGAEPDEGLRRQLKRAARGAVELRLGAERFISRSLQLPAAGRDYLSPIIEHRLERLTPWRPEKVMYGFALTGDESGEGTIDVAFLASSTAIVDQKLDRLSEFNLTPTAIGSIAEPLEAPLEIDLYRGERDITRRRVRQASMTALIFVTLLVVPLFSGSLALSWIAGDRLDQLEEDIAGKRRLLANLTGQNEAESRDLELINAKREETAAMLLVDRLAKIVPDDTYLREMEIDGARVRLAGFSRNAPGLIGILENDDALSNVRFTAPVTREDSGLDAFDITGEWSARRPLTPDTDAPTEDSNVPAEPALEVQP